MISKFLLSIFIFTSIFYSVGCCGISCRFVGGATYDVTFPDGTMETIKATTESDGSGCINYDCDKGDPSSVQIVVNPQV